ncbi:MAG: glycerol kinase GlpK [Bacilli bacterium]|nr:glycerol kinase GlpK [Bacilli bacterium]
MKKYILAVDQGTTSTRAILFSKKGEPLFKAQRPIDLYYPKPGWVEMSADAIWISVVDVINELMIVSGAKWEEIAGIGITNQRETTIVWDKATGKAIHNAIVWQSKQTQKICERYEKKKSFIANKTGLRLNPYFSSSKIRFILENVKGAEEKAKKGDLRFGTVDTWLIYKMTNGAVHATDVSNASRTAIYNIYDMKWDEELLKLWKVPACMLPEVRDSSCDFGEATFFPGHVHIYGVAGDQQAALFGQCCYREGESKNTYGTGCFMLMNTGNTPVPTKSGLLTTVAWRINGVTTYALEGSVFIGGAVVQWVRDQTRWIEDSKDSEFYSKKVDDTAGVYFVPAFVGLGTPYWDDDARGAIFGLTRGADRHHITRAALNSIAYQSKDVIDAMKKDAKLTLPVLKVDGGASANDLLMQFQSDILQCEVRIPHCVETTALGAGYLAGLACGFWKNTDEIEKNQTFTKRYFPTMDPKEADKLCRGWAKAITATRAFKVK